MCEIPSNVSVHDRKLREEKKLKCKLLGCHVSNHRTARSELCTYHEFYVNKTSLESAVDERLRLLYPQFYGEYDVVFISLWLLASQVWWFVFEIIIFVVLFCELILYFEQSIIIFTHQYYSLIYLHTFLQIRTYRSRTSYR